jgi:ATPase subunit of ABC transporter with duplicated ATPase domains
MTMSDKITIQFDGKDVQVTPIQPGVVQKTASIFYIQDSVTKEYLYCFPARLERLLEKYNGDLSQYKGRDTKAREREAAKATKKAEREAKKAEAEAKAKAKAEAAAAAKVEAPVEEPAVEA